MISRLYAAHQQGNKNAGFDIEGEGPAVKDAVEAGILDLFNSKWWGIKLATNAATTVLRVDQVGVVWEWLGIGGCEEAWVSCEVQLGGLGEW